MDEYADMSKEARQEALNKIRQTDKQISEIYKKSLAEMTAKAAQAKEGSLTQRWALDMAASLKDSIRRLSGNMESAITDAATEAARIPGDTAGDWLHGVYTNAGGNLTGETFRNMFTRGSDDALRMVLSGRAYLDGKTLSSRIWAQTGRLENGINQVIQQGIAQKKSAIQIARELEQYVNPDARETLKERRARATENKDASNYPPLQFPGNTEYNCLRLARTSVNHAYFLSMKNSAKLNPFCSAVHWELSGEHFARQVAPFGVDICDEYATHNEGLGIGNWPVDGVPLPHAQCLCSQWPDVPQTLDECAARLKSWLDGGEDAALDDSFSAWKDAMQSGLTDRRLSSIRDDAGEVRKQLLTQIAGRADVKAMSVADRQKLFDELNNASENELRGYSIEQIKNSDHLTDNKLEGDRLDRLLNKLGISVIIKPEPQESAEEVRHDKLRTIRQQAWYKSLDDKDRIELIKQFSNMTDDELEFWVRHGSLVEGKFYSTGGSYYRVKAQEVNLDVSNIDSRARRVGLRTNTIALFHETGHLLDARAYAGKTIVGEMPELRTKLENDFLNYANKRLAARGMKPLAQLSDMTHRQELLLRKDLSQDAHLKNSVSDLAEGITDGKVKGIYGHMQDDPQYWQGRDALESEAVAHMFESEMNKGERKTQFEEVFPESLQYFEDTIKRLEGK